MDRRQRSSRVFPMVVVTEREFRVLAEPRPSDSFLFALYYYVFPERRGTAPDRRTDAPSIPLTVKTHETTDAKWDEAARLGIEFAEWWDTCKDMSEPARTIQRGSVFAQMVERYLKGRSE